MPCRDWQEDNCDGLRNDVRNLQNKVDTLTRLLCLATSCLFAKSETTKELHDWYIQHQEMDKKRIAHEKAIQEQNEARQAALDKLTAKEKRLLGING